MTDTLGIFVLCFLFAGAGFIYHSLGMLEIARQASADACRRAGVQFLDDTVAGCGIKPARNQQGHRVFERRYRFEFTDTGAKRLEGITVLLGKQVKSITLEPYQDPDMEYPGLK